MIAAIEGATEAIWMESYIFVADEVGARFVAALAAKARTGLDVQLHLDAFAAGHWDFDKFRRELERSGVRFRWFRPFDLRHPLRYFQHNHRKLLVVDGRDAFLGGFNIRRLNSRRLHGSSRQRDTHVRVQGSLATLAASHFDRLWRAGVPPTPSPKRPAGSKDCWCQATRASVRRGLPVCTRD
tara:strand:- start:2338 stop:2886 length:549 start_codon:yes stop_codon:yes gene_type:complete